MSKIGTYAPLQKVYFKQYFSFKADRDERKKQLKLYAICAVAFIPMIIAVCYGVYAFAGVLASVGKFEVLISLLYTVGIIIVFLFGIMSYLSIMFFSNDNDVLSVLPIRSSVIFSVKMLTIYLSELLITTAVFLPTLIVAGVAASKVVSVGIGYYLAIPAAIFVMPAIPLALISILASPIMFIANVFKRNSILAGVMMILMFCGIMFAYTKGVSMLMGAMPKNPADDIEVMTKFIASIEAISKIFYPMYLFACLVTAKGSVLFNLGIFSVIWIGLAALAFFATVTLYRYNVTRLSEFSSNKMTKIKKDSKQKKQLYALVIKEIKDVVQNPSLFFYCVMGIVMTPIMLLIFGNFTAMAPPTDGSFSAINTIMNSKVFGISIAVFFSSMMLCGMNYIALIGFSRERDSFSILKTLPVKPLLIVKSKLYLANCLTAVGAIICGIVVACVNKVDAINVIIFIVMTIFYGCSMNSFGLYRDLKNVRLNWISLKEITNRNINAILPMMISMVVGMVLEVVTLVTLVASKNNTILSLAVLWVLYGLFALIFYMIFTKRLYERADAMFNNIEV